MSWAYEGITVCTCIYLFRLIHILGIVLSYVYHYILHDYARWYSSHFTNEKTEAKRQVSHLSKVTQTDSDGGSKWTCLCVTHRPLSFTLATLSLPNRGSRSIRWTGRMGTGARWMPHLRESTRTAWARQAGSHSALNPISADSGLLLRLPWPATSGDTNQV